MAKNPLPRVSVVTPMYNAEAYIELAVRSVLAQSFTDFEYIVVNDGSSDQCGAIVDLLALEDARLKVIHLPENVGNSRANNRGFAEARGEYIACMDADDICHPQRLEKQVEYLDAHPQMGLVATQYWRMSPAGEVLRKTRNKLTNVVLRFQLLFAVPVCNPTTFFRRQIVDEMLPDVYSPRLKAAADYDFLCRVAERWDMHVLPDYLFYYRINPNGLSKQKKHILIDETTAKAIPHIQSTLPDAGLSDADIAVFIEVQGNAAAGIDARRREVYSRVLRALCDAYVKPLNARERCAVRMFCVELEAKTLGWRHKLVKKPALLARWLPGFFAFSIKACVGR
ncbi:MAG: glycosyltransferase family 2 protein [Alphaproteobacteria bacterium]|nr:MAG: glycosyltransferase family 2 protein [Alphaproteobacteria bacterium]